MTDYAIIEAARRALAECGFYDNEATAAAKTMLTAATPLIRAAALEEAAQRIEADEEDYLVRNEVAAVIRALISPSPSPSADSA